MNNSILSITPNNHDGYLSSDPGGQNSNSHSGLLPYGGMASVPYDHPHGVSASASSGYNATTLNDYWSNSSGIDELVKNISPVTAVSDESVEIIGHLPDPPSDPPVVIGGNGGGSGGGGGGGTSMTVVGHKNGFDHVVTINGTDFLQDGSGGIVSSNRFDGNNTTVTPIPLATLINSTNDLYQRMFERDAGDADRSWVSQELYDPNTMWAQIVSIEAHNAESTADLQQAILNIQGRSAQAGDDAWVQAMQDREQNNTDSLTSIYMNTAIWTGEHGGYDSIIHDVQDRSRSDGDTNWIQAQEQAIGSRQQTYASVRGALIDNSGENGVINLDIYQNVHDRTALQVDLDYARSQMHNGLSIQQVIWNEAHNSESTTTINGVYKIILGRDADSGGMQTWQNSIGNGATLNDTISGIAHSDEAKTQVSGFLTSSFGQVTDGLTNAGQAMLTGIAQAYQTVKNYTQAQLQGAANGYQPALGTGLLLNQVMPQTWQGWVAFAPLLVLELTPPGEAAVATVMTAAGVDELLTAAFETGLEQDMTLFASKAVVSETPGTYAGAVKDFAVADPMAGGSTVELSDGTTIVQTASTKYQKEVLDYTGANETSIEDMFRELTGFTGSLDEAKVYEGSDGVVYTVEMPDQTVTMRTVSSSGKDWTIDLKNPLSNGVKRIKFSR